MRLMDPGSQCERADARQRHCFRAPGFNGKMPGLWSGRKLALLVCFVTVFSSSCLVRRRTVPPPGKVKENRPLLVATEAELIRRIHAASDAIQSFTLKADMSPSVGQLYGGQVTDYATITGFVLFRRPDDIRVIGQDPVIHSTLFDMVSTGNDFRVSLPTKNQFVIGTNDAPAVSKNKLENLRPAAFLTSLMIMAPAGTDLTLMEDDTNETKAVYIVQVVQRQGDQLRLMRNIYFDRYTLEINRQKTFDANGYIKSDTKYSEWRTFNGIGFPTLIDIQRPQDGYELILTVLDMKINQPEVTAEKFVLNQPPNAKVKVLGTATP
jgi:outer membrane lipoprotein-sorting protein